jgi:phosphoglycolate phosphatase
MSLDTSIECVLFDLDGTLIDTAPDFVEVVARLCAENKRPAVSEGDIYQTVSDGARALTKLAFAIDEEHQDFARLNQRLLDIYEQQIATSRSRLYPGLEQLLGKLEASKIPWGIVTNKPLRYAEALLQVMQLDKRCASLICPDHVSERKPHPEPILLACQQLQADTERTVYIGDHIRDIQAAKNADVIAVAAAWGYLPADTLVEEWYADFILRQPEQFEALLQTLKFA